VLTFFRRKHATQPSAAPPTRCLELLELLEDLGHPALLADALGYPLAANFSYSMRLLETPNGAGFVMWDCQTSDDIAGSISSAANHDLNVDVITVRGRPKRVRLISMGDDPPLHVGVFDTAREAAGAKDGIARMTTARPQFTRHESAIIEKLAQGDTLASVADRSRVSYNTLRKQLRSMMARSGANTQAQLVAKYLGSVETEGN